VKYLVFYKFLQVLVWKTQRLQTNIPEPGTFLERPQARQHGLAGGK
jgi:hypothetical protein